jgi:hypothetical protein
VIHSAWAGTIVTTTTLALPPPSFTRRDAYLPAIPGKAIAVVGMRRSGKTTFLWQCLSDRLQAGAAREAQLYLNFEDERLVGLQATDLQWVVEDYYRLAPQRIIRMPRLCSSPWMPCLPSRSCRRQCADSRRYPGCWAVRSDSPTILLSCCSSAYQIQTHPFQIIQAGIDSLAAS